MTSKESLSVNAHPSDTAMPPWRHPVSGMAIFIGLLLQIASFTGLPIGSGLVGYFFWVAVALLWTDLDPRTRLQAGVLSTAGLILLLVSRYHYQSHVDWPTILGGNTYVVAMLVGVSFIGLIGSRGGDKGHASVGTRGLISTWLSVHMLGSILNLSSVFMIGDHIKARAPLQLPQILTLNRGLSSAAFWSPFFASMGVAMSAAPEMHYVSLLVTGLPLALISCLVTRFEMQRRFDLSNVHGFSLSPTSLLMPVSMAALVMLFHYVLTPSLTIVSIITFLLPVAALILNLPKGMGWTARRVLTHTRVRLPAMRGEVSLFLSAGLFTLGLSTFIDAATGSQWVLFDHFGAREAMMSYLAIIASAMIGLHPIIGVSTLASLLDIDSVNHTLLGLVALCAWAVGAAIGPLSGINLSLQGRYDTNGYRIMKNNIVYALLMSGCVFVAIMLVANAT
ncbi:hypothetical protein [Aidingimonas halophila]|uniref:Uncharacterized protein n=1 Tax=Aidingimonas halophila TaxID=574349 RepID=A0A1H3DJI9_9GAMM|nr:hypothetical protein [Aidingimonas halophila]GHC29836.1 hypothetical protein GCM10008094_22550 [Aidingimonas halophila]SDX65829.1 hypothetical protein SAMN05443545_106293 [Aidingimonas halophila]